MMMTGEHLTLPPPPNNTPPSLFLLLIIISPLYNIVLIFYVIFLLSTFCMDETVRMMTMTMMNTKTDDQGPSQIAQSHSTRSSQIAQ